MNDGWSAFFGGMVAGAVVLAVLMHGTASSPRQIEKQYQQKAIELGYATNVIVLKDSEYVVQFNWITNR